jgi:hypothetical protein
MGATQDDLAPMCNRPKLDPDPHSTVPMPVRPGARSKAKCATIHEPERVPKMLDLDQLKQSTINPSVAKEVYAQAEKRLGDVLDTKKGIEQKASTFFSAYLTVSLALFGIGGAIFKEQGLSGRAIPFFISGGVFVVGAFIFMLALKDERYGLLGSPPDMWLNKGMIDGESSALDATYAYLAFHHAERIAISMDSNQLKMRRVRCGMWLGLAATVIFAGCFILFVRA